MIGISQGFKTFWVYLKALLENYFKLSIIFLKNFFEKDQVSKYYFPILYSNLWKHFRKGIVLQNDYKVFYAKGRFEKYISKTIFVKFILWI
jgi:hypothetical protein